MTVSPDESKEQQFRPRKRSISFSVIRCMPAGEASFCTPVRIDWARSPMAAGRPVDPPGLGDVLFLREAYALEAFRI
jgi:hypothetical protein